VGAVDPAYPVGTLALPDQYLDRTRARDDTFFDEDDVQHLRSATRSAPRGRACLPARQCLTANFDGTGLVDLDVVGSRQTEEA
jgi:purine nucleoside phosphorylase